MVVMPASLNSTGRRDCSVWFRRSTRPFACGTLLDPSSTPSCLQAVSYTQLDVYKRQKRTFAIRFRYLLMNAGVSRTAFKLAVVQLRIEAALSHQCIMVTLLNDISILHDQNQIGIPDC